MQDPKDKVNNNENTGGTIKVHTTERTVNASMLFGQNVGYSTQPNPSSSAPSDNRPK